MKNILRKKIPNSSTMFLNMSKTLIPNIQNSITLTLESMVLPIDFMKEKILNSLNEIHLF